MAGRGEASFEDHQSLLKLVNASLKNQAIGTGGVLDAHTLDHSAPQGPLLSSYGDSFEGCGQPYTKLNYFLPETELFSNLQGVGLDPQELNLVNHSTDSFSGQNYYSMFGFMNNLLTVPNLPLRLQDEQNPVLTIGKTKLMMGTPDAPVMADSLLLPAVWTQLKSQLPAPFNTQLVAFIEIFQHRAKSEQQLTGLPKGHYALVTYLYDPAPGCACGLQLRLETTDDGLLPLINAKTKVRLTDTPAALADAKATGVPAVLVYRVGTVDDLRQIPLTPIKISGLKVVRK